MWAFKQFLSEGGNVKIGDVAAAPFPISEKNRASVRADAHEALSALHDSFHKETGKHLFGKDKKAIKTNSAFAGSTRHLMGNEVSDKEFAKHKRDVGDFDVFVPHQHKEDLHSHVKTGMKLGKYTVAGKNKSSVLMKHENGQVHQYDMVGAKYEKNEPSEGEQFTHSSHWGDTQKGIKGAHHKQLLNAVGLDKHKFSITHGVRSRTDEKDKGAKHPKDVSSTLFGSKAEHNKIHSFQGVSELIAKHVPKEKHQAIYDKFKDSVKSNKFNNKPAITHLASTLNIKDNLKEHILELFEAKQEVHHTSVIPLVGFSPISHMGHAADLGGKMKELPGTKHIGISGKSDVFSPEERSSILSKQWGDKNVKHHIGSPAGEVIRRAHDSLPAGKKHLHLLVGGDRLEWAKGLKASLEAGKIKEMEGKKFHNITVHTPDDVERKHGLSGTNMRTAASKGDKETFKKHLGNMFSDKETNNIMNKVKSSLDSGAIKVKRK